MSATGRSKSRAPWDFYRTPDWLVEAIVPHLPYATNVLDPACGDGAILRALQPYYYTIGIDIAPELLQRCECDEKHLDSAFATPGIDDVDLVVMNPPYKLAQEFVEYHVARYRTVAALLRLGFMAGQARAEFLRTHPFDLYVSPRRPSFTGQGTDASDYGWFIWSPDATSKITILKTEKKGPNDEP